MDEARQYPKVGDRAVSKCPRCGEVKDLWYGPDPYQSDINDDDTPVWQCDDCAYESAQDI